MMKDTETVEQELRRLRSENAALKESNRLLQASNEDYSNRFGDRCKEIADAVLTERERCAKVCEATDECLSPDANPSHFAAAIRKGTV